MVYELLKSAHITFMAIWMSGMVLVTVFLFQPASDSADTVRKYDRRVTTPAMVLTWACGVALALHANWFGANWLWAKLILVVALSAFHGMLVGRLRQATHAHDATLQQFKPVLILWLFALLASVAWLVVAKPF